MFDDSIDPTSVNTNSFVVLGDQHGPYTGTYAVMNNQIRFSPVLQYLPGEWITVNLTPGISSTGGASLTPHAFQLLTKTEGCTTFTFTDSGQLLMCVECNDLKLGDVDGDGDTDAAFADVAGPGTVFFNGGGGLFTDSGQMINFDTDGLDLGDIDGDSDLDMLFAQTGPNMVYINNGSGFFTDSGQLLGSAASRKVRLGDLDGNGDVDAAWANAANGPNTIYTNDGSGQFSNSGQLWGVAGMSQSRGLQTWETWGTTVIWTSLLSIQPARPTGSIPTTG